MEEQARILCVDDEKNVLKALERFFLDSDCEIITATSAEEGLEILQNGESVQIVISDYRMPGMNGVDFLKEVYRQWPDTIRMVISGYAETSSIVAAINEGQIFRFIPKPWNDDELKAAISNAVECCAIKQKNVQLTEELKKKNQKLQEINDNLEEIVAARTSELVMQNKILTRSQNILDALPVAVMEIDPEGLIAQCNKKGNELIKHKKHILGLNRQDMLTNEMNRIAEMVAENGSITRKCANNGTTITIKGTYMKYDNDQEGVILVFDEATDGE